MKTGRIFGVEIECSDCDHGYTPNGWERKWEHCGYEYVSPLLSGDDGLNQIRGLYEAIRPRVNSYCGLHVHIDVRDFNDDEKMELVKRLRADKHLFTEKVDPSRLTNGFCDGDLPVVRDGESFYAYTRRLHGDRYVWVNLLAVYKHGSIEFRLHEATEDSEKVCQWVEFLTTYVENVKTNITITKCPRDVDKSLIISKVDFLVSDSWSDSYDCTYQRDGLR